MVMNLDEAWRIVQKQIDDYDAWQLVVTECRAMAKELCKHPQPMGCGEFLLCTMCYVKIEDKDIHYTWKAFSKQSIVNEARIIVDLYVKEHGKQKS